MPLRFRVRELLVEAGVSQRQLAELTGLHYVTVNRICVGATTQVSLNTLERIADALGVEPGDLIGREAPKRRRS